MKRLIVLPQSQQGRTVVLNKEGIAGIERVTVRFVFEDFKLVPPDLFIEAYCQQHYQPKTDMEWKPIIEEVRVPMAEFRRSLQRWGFAATRVYAKEHPSGYQVRFVFMRNAQADPNNTCANAYSSLTADRKTWLVRGKQSGDRVIIRCALPLKSALQHAC